MRKHLIVAVLGLTLAGCTSQPPDRTTTPAIMSDAEVQEAELEAVYARTGLQYLQREEMILQPKASVPTLTFNLGSACSGEIEKPEDTKYAARVFTRENMQDIINITFQVGDPGLLSGADIEKVAKACPE